MVVYWFVGETPGICWMQAVKRKKRFAYFENCSAPAGQRRPGQRGGDSDGPRRNFGMKEARLYLLVLT
jgi:hypothetical protein